MHHRRTAVVLAVAAMPFAVSPFGLSPFAASPAFATDLVGVLPASLDQPRINALLERPAGGGPLTADFGGLDTFNIQAFFDTGASGIVMSQNTADFLGVQRVEVGGQRAVYTDVGVGGTSEYNVSELLNVRLASYNPLTDVDNLPTYTTVYNQQFTNQRAQIGPLLIDPGNPLLADLDVFGIPLMQNKVVVMDPKPVDTFLDTMRTYVYDPGTPFNAATAASNPGIPATNRHVTLSYGDFGQFTTLGPAGAPAPSFEDNPFIGPNPVLVLDPAAPADPTPGVKLSYDGLAVETSLLLDTGAATNIVSTGVAAQLGVTYAANSTDANPVLAGVPLEEQFQLTVGGTGGTKKVAGFFMDSALVRTQEGDAANDADANHLNYQLWPTLVLDISVEDPDTLQTITLDGIFGMNNMVASAFLIETGDFPVIGGLSRGFFDWLTFDQPNGVLGLQLKDTTGTKADLEWFGDLFTNANEWDIDTSAHWLADFGFVTYQQGDRVLFGPVTLQPSVEIVAAVAPGGVTVDNDVDSGVYRFFGPGKITGFTGLIKQGTGTLRIETQNDYTGATDVQGGRVEFAAPQDIGPVLVRAAGEAAFLTSQTFDALSVEGTAAISPGGNKVVRVGMLAVSGDFDITDQKVLIDVAEGEEAPLEDVRAMLAAGLLNSSTAAPDERIGYATGSAAPAFGGSFFGQAYEEDDVLVLVTLAGDANLDGMVNLSDFNSLAVNFGTDGYWHEGDFNYDGVVNLADFNLLAANFGKSILLGASVPTDDPAADLAALWSAAEAANVPEPTTLAPMLAAAGLLRRRRR